MGIKNLLKIINSNTPNAIEYIKMDDLKDKTIGIDTSLILYQFKIALCSKNITLTDANNNSTVHICAIINKILYFYKNKIKPIFVFDNKPSMLKDNILIKRKEKKIKAKENLKKSDINDEEKTKLLKSIVSITDEEINEIIEILELIGNPYIIAAEEADSQLAYMAKNNLIDYIYSEDMDILTFGGTKLIKNIGKKNMFIVNLDKILEEGNLKFKEFIELCILLGCDYINKIKGIGDKKAWNLISKYKSISNIGKNLNIAIKDNYDIVINYFINCIHNKIKINELNFKIPNLTKLKNILKNKYNFNDKTIEDIIKKINLNYL